MDQIVLNEDILAVFISFLGKYQSQKVAKKQTFRELHREQICRISTEFIQLQWEPRQRQKIGQIGVSSGILLIQIFQCRFSQNIGVHQVRGLQGTSFVWVSLNALMGATCVFSLNQHFSKKICEFLDAEVRIFHKIDKVDKLFFSSLIMLNI